LTLSLLLLFREERVRHLEGCIVGEDAPKQFNEINRKKLDKFTTTA